MCTASAALRHQATGKPAAQSDSQKNLHIDMLSYLAAYSRQPRSANTLANA
jgi:hypothetical protein